MNYILFDNKHKVAMQPLSFTRPQAAIRCGILTVKEKWEHHLLIKASYLCSDVLAKKYHNQVQDDNVYLSSSVLPSATLVLAVKALRFGEALVKEGHLIAVRTGVLNAEEVLNLDISLYSPSEFSGDIQVLEKVFHLLPLNQDQIKKDFELLTAGRSGQEISETVTVVGLNKNPDLINRIFIEEGAEVECCYLNPKDGPIYIGKNATVMEGAMLRGPVALCESAQISMGAKIYAGASIGPWSKVGGEMGNSIITGYSNKVHDGYLGDSVLGEWCNLGADTNTSNLKNDYAKVKLWDYSTERFQRTNLQFCGLMMGDFSRCAINTAFNSGTVVGVGSNIFGSGFPRNFVPSFVIGGPQGYKVNGLKSVTRVATTAMGRRNVPFEEADLAVLEEVYQQTTKYRSSLK